LVIRGRGAFTTGATVSDCATNDGAEN